MILGIDCAGVTGSVAIGQGDAIYYTVQLHTGLTHSERILPMVVAALEAVDLDVADVQAVAVTQGPGSFTGLRIGMSTAKGLAQGAGLSFVAVSTLDVLAYQGRFYPGLVCPILNARRGEVYTALFEGGQGKVRRLAEDQALSLDGLCHSLQGQGPIYFCGDGLDAYADDLAGALGDHALMPQGPDRYIHGAALVALAQKKLDQHGPDDLFHTMPIYLRQSEAVLRWQAQHPGKSLED